MVVSAIVAILLDLRHLAYVLLVGFNLQHFYMRAIDEALLEFIPDTGPQLSQFCLGGILSAFGNSIDCHLAVRIYGEFFDMLMCFEASKAMMYGPKLGPGHCLRSSKCPSCPI